MATLKYKGDGTEFLNNVPARDLDGDEYRALPVEARKALRGAVQSGGKPLYDYAGFRAADQGNEKRDDDAAKTAAELAGEAAAATASRACGASTAR